MTIYDEKKKAVIITFEISWDGDVGRCYEFYKDALAEAGIKIPGKDELPSDQVDSLMSGLADEMAYAQPSDMDSYLHAIGSTVRDWIIEGLEQYVKYADIRERFENEFPVWEDFFPVWEDEHETNDNCEMSLDEFDDRVRFDMIW